MQHGFHRLEDGTDSPPPRPPHDSRRPNPPKRAHFDYLDGCRTLMTLWVTLEHYGQRHHLTHGDLRHLLSRGNVPVDYYVILSGFVTAHAYCDRPFVSGQYDRERAKFYLKRFGRVGLSYYASLALSQAVALVAAGGVVRLPASKTLAAAALVLLMAQSLVAPWWGEVMIKALNPNAWTISVLAWFWLLYPYLQPLVRTLSERALALLALLALVASWASMLPVP